ncbi:MAG: SH3 domain-containing protein [Chloroflexi bacterium]|nr:SH3 domain-containing protein [Chloroflexota bacterium]
MNRLLRGFVLTILIVSSLFTAAVVFGQGGGVPSNQGVVTKNDGDLGIYAEPNVGSEILGTAPNGSTVDIFSVDGLWAEVSYEGVSGYALTSDLEIGPAHVNLQGIAATQSDVALRTGQDIQADVVGTVPPGSVLGIVEIDGVWALAYDGDHIGWTFTNVLDISDPTSDLADLVQSQAVTTSDTAVALRAAPDISSETIGTLETDTAVVVGAEDGVFAYVISDGGNGWAFKANLDITPRGRAHATVSAAPANLREEGSKDSAQVTVLGLDTPLLLLARNEAGDWLYVRVQSEYYIGGELTSGFEGWISASLVDAGDFDLSTLPVE